jgi:hypothetical protein
VVVDGNTGLDLIAELADTTLEAIRELNPHLLRGMTPPGQRYPVRLPAGSAEKVRVAYAAVPPSERVTMLTHVVRRGETVSGIAKRYGVSTDLLMSSNPLATTRSAKASGGSAQTARGLTPGPAAICASTGGTAIRQASTAARDVRTIGLLQAHGNFRMVCWHCSKNFGGVV